MTRTVEGSKKRGSFTIIRIPEDTPEGRAAWERGQKREAIIREKRKKELKRRRDKESPTAQIRRAIARHRVRARGR